MPTSTHYISSAGKQREEFLAHFVIVAITDLPHANQKQYSDLGQIWNSCDILGTVVTHLVRDIFGSRYILLKKNMYIICNKHSYVEVEAFPSVF